MSNSWDGLPLALLILLDQTEADPDGDAARSRWNVEAIKIETWNQSARLMESLLKSYKSGEVDPWRQAVDAGLVAEWLAKNITVRQGNVRRLVPGKPGNLKHEKFVAFFEGKGHPEVQSFLDVMSVPLPLSLRAAMGLEAEDDLPDDWERLGVHRNAAAHVAFASDKGSDFVFGETSRISLALLGRIEGDAEPWLSPRGTTLLRLAALLDDDTVPYADRKGLRLAVLARLWRAGDLIATLRSNLPEHTWELLARQPEKPVDLEGDDAFIAPCLSGHHLAWYDVHLEENDLESDDEERVLDAVPSLDCPLCGFYFDGSDFEYLWGQERIGRLVGDRDDWGLDISEDIEPPLEAIDTFIHAWLSGELRNDKEMPVPVEYRQRDIPTPE